MREERMYLRAVLAVFGMVLVAVMVMVVSKVRPHQVREVEAPVVKVVRDSWLDASRQGAPIYRAEGGPVALPLKPEGKRVELYANGYVFATDDLADVRRWYAALTAPALDLNRFPFVRYVYEVEHVELVERDGREVLAVTIHDARSGCAKPACDPVTELPNYDRRYVVTSPNRTVHIEGGGNV
jgi:hypothetical protein